MSKIISVSNFLTKDFREFSLYDCWTNIPSMIDGLKISQRKAMWTVLNNPKSMTVEQLASLAASYTKYHHGATNQEGVIVGLARNYTGSNNVNWLTPDGQFGNILNNKASSARYISATLSPNWRKWFSKEDDIILEFEIEDGDITEPKYFIPLVPTVLFNGGNGIGTGYSNHTLSYNPQDVINNVKKVLAGKEQDEIIPWYNGYKGKITKNENQVIFSGSFEKVNATAIRITQVPIGHDLESYKEILIALMESGEIKDFDDHSTEDKWDIVVYANREWIKQHETIIIEKLKLTTKDTETLVFWNENQKIIRFNDVRELIKHFVDWRVQKFEDRRVKLIEKYQAECEWLSEKRDFIKYFIDNSKSLVSLSKDELIKKLEEKNFKNIDRLLQIRVYNMTKDEVTSLEQEIVDVEVKIDTLEKTTAKDMYKAELNIKI